MALETKMKNTSTAGRRFLFGTNVAVLVLLLVFVLGGVNLLANMLAWRTDLSGGLTSARVSERTERILDAGDKDIRITTVYISEEPGKERRDYFPKLRDYCSELAHASKKVKVNHIITAEERVKLRDRIESSFRSVADEHESAIELARSTWNELRQSLPRIAQQISAVSAMGDLQAETSASWLGHFTPLARFTPRIEEGLGNLEETGNEVEGLVSGEGIPRYQEANSKIRQSTNGLKGDLEKMRGWLRDMNGLSEMLSSPNSDFATKSLESLAELEKWVQNLEQAAGDPSQPVPEDPKPLLQKFASAANTLKGWAVDEQARMQGQSEATPGITQDNNWFVPIERETIIGTALVPTAIPEFLALEAANLSSWHDGIRQNLQQNLTPRELQDLAERVQRVAAAKANRLRAYRQSVESILRKGANIDEASKAVMDLAAEDGQFDQIIERLDAITEAIDDLPELKLDDLATRMEEENLVVVEYGDDVRVLKFDDIWPINEPMSARMSRPQDQSETVRVFRADAAVSSALLAMSQPEPFATVIIVGFEPQPEQQMPQQMRSSHIPLISMNELSTLKELLEQANFEIKEWNLGDDDPAASKPEPAKGTEAVYLVLPPAVPPPQNMMMRQQGPQKEFGETEMRLLRDAIEGSAGAIFLASWEMRIHPMMGSLVAEYGYAGYLRDHWGIEVQDTYRLLRMVPDANDPDKFGLDPEQFSHLQLSTFTEHPIGKPLKARRMLWGNACPVRELKNAEGESLAPENVTVQPVLTVPAGVRDTWAETQQYMQMLFYYIQTGQREGKYEKVAGRSLEPPFAVVLAATKKIEPTIRPAGEEAGEGEADDRAPARDHRRVVVLGMGRSFTDDYLQQRVPRLESDGKRASFSTDPPPLEDVELLVNAACWIGGRDDMIAAGPPDIPRVPALSKQAETTSLVVVLAWAVAIGVVGGVVMMARRK